MNLYEIEITEILKRVISEKANSYDEAMNKVREKYHNEKIVLDSDDYVETNFKPHKQQLIKDNFKIAIEFDKDVQEITFIQNLDSKSYICKTNQDLKEIMQSYFDNNLELEDIDNLKNKEKEKERKENERI